MDIGDVTIWLPRFVLLLGYGGCNAGEGADGNAFIGPIVLGTEGGNSHYMCGCHVNCFNRS